MRYIAFFYHPTMGKRHCIFDTKQDVDGFVQKMSHIVQITNIHCLDKKQRYYYFIENNIDWIEEGF